MIFLPEAENCTIVPSFFWTKHRNVTDGQADRITLAITAVCVHEIIASTHKPKPLHRKKMQNGGRLLSVLSTNNFLHGWSTPITLVVGAYRRSINVVVLRRAGLVLEWVTVHGQVNHLSLQSAIYVNSAWPILCR